MKTAISLPDTVFNQADQLATKMHVSRSQLYVMALEKFISEHQGSHITKKIDDYIAKHGQPIDPVFLQGALTDRRRGEW